MALSEKLIEDGRVEEGIRFLELEIELAPGKVWLIRKAAQACIANARPEKALKLAEQGLALKPEDEALATVKADAEEDLGLRE